MSKYVDGAVAVGGKLVLVGGESGYGWVMREVVGVAVAGHVHERDAARRRRPGGGEQRA